MPKANQQSASATNAKRVRIAKRKGGCLQGMVGRPVEFHVKGSEWKKMPAKTKAALAEMVKCAAKQFGGAK